MQTGWATFDNSYSSNDHEITASDIDALLENDDDSNISPIISYRDSNSLDFTNIHSIPLSLSLSRSETELPRTVTLWNGLTLIIGMCIGSGIFASPGPILGFTKSVGMSLFVWLLAGCLALTGSLCYAELGTMIQTSGGEHAYLSKAYGTLPAFLFSWTGILVTRPGSVAIITTIFADYVVRLIYFEHPHGTAPEVLTKFIAILCVGFLTAVNCWSTRLGTLIQDVFTVLKLVALIIIGVIGIWVLSGGGRSEMKSHNFDGFWDGSSTNPGDYALALYSALWAYDGWNSLNLVTGELKNPSKNIPRAVIIGPVIVILCYLLANIAYYAVLPPEIVMHSSTIAVDFGKAIFGSIGGVIIPLIVIGSTFGAANGTIFSGARVVYISSKAGHAPAFLAKVHPDLNTPIAALILQGVLSSIFVSIGNFTSLVNFYSMIAWTFYLLAVLALLVMRWKHPAIERPFKVPLSVPLVFVCVTVFLITASIVEAPIAAAWAFAFLGSGVPVWWMGRRGIKFEDAMRYVSILFMPIILILQPILSKIPIPNSIRSIFTTSSTEGDRQFNYRSVIESIKDAWNNLGAMVIGFMSGVRDVEKFRGGSGHGYTKQSMNEESLEMAEEVVSIEDEQDVK